MNIGIDLGTTFSVIAVKGRVKIQGNYPAPQYLDECDVSLIPSPLAEFAIPSAFWRDPNDPTRTVVGSEAKELANQGETPILFSKRCIGTTQKLKIGHQEFTAKEVATEILKYLKRCAEDAMGIPISRVVITHPAYFTRNQVEETREAAIAAGFDMSLGDQMMMEPVAAAMAYIASDSRERVNALTYDLGGGTFDVTVVEKRDGVITMKAFDGNPLLGGYNFDRRFASWLLERVKKSLAGTGRELKLDEDVQADQCCWARLLQLAEKVKCELVLKPTAKVPVPIKSSDILHDTNGKPIPIIDRITREEYAALIQDLLDDTVEKSRSAITKAGIKAEDLDIIVLAGGSSYGQWVQETVKRAFPNTNVKLDSSPDLCVGAGAALFADELPKTSQTLGSEFAIVADVPRLWALPTITIMGTVQKSGGAALDTQVRQELRVILETPEPREFGPVSLNDDSVFMFQDVELLDGEPTKLVLKLLDSQSRERAEQLLVVELTETPGVTPPMQVVPKPIFVRTASGLITIAKEAERLPVKSREIKLKRIQDDATIHLDIFQGTDWVSTIKVEGIPADAGSGSTVSLNIGITKQNLMQGTVTVRRKDNSVATEWPVAIPFPPIEIPSLPELEDAFNRVNAKRVEEIHNEKNQVRRTLLGTQGEKLAKKIKALFSEPVKDLQEINQGIKELEAMLAVQRDEMQPSEDKLNGRVADCGKAIAESDATDKKQKYLEDLEKIKIRANDAKLLKDQKQWAFAFSELESLYARITYKPGKKEEEEEDDDLPETSEIIDHFHKIIVLELSTALEAMQQSLISKPEFEFKYLPRCQKVQEEINTLAERIKAVDKNLKPKKAYKKLAPIEDQKPNVERMIQEIPHETKAI